MTEPRIRSHSRAALLRLPITSLTTLALLCQAIVPAYGQIVADPNAGARQPGIDRAANGTPVVNITTPTATGLSHNQFTDFNVGSAGVVLNNSAELSTSQIAGLVIGNPNLTKGSEASLILNEVTGTNRSQLTGYLEVQGKAASVIVANPNGITCSGCGFINTPRATLTTGRPVFDTAGNLRSFNVTGGSIVVGPDGLDASRTSRFELVSRLVEISGALRAQELTISGGRQNYDYTTQTAMPIADDGATKPQFFLDAGALGAMYANRIRIVGNELGLGVRAPAKLLAAAGDLLIEAQGRVVVNDASATDAVTIRSTTDAIDITGTTYSEGNLTLATATGATVSDNAVLGARNQLSLTAQSLTLGKATIAAGLASDGTLVLNGGSAQFRIDGATSIAVGGLISGGERLDLVTGSGLANGGTLQADTLLTLTTGGDLANTGRLLSTADIQLRSGRGLTVASAGSIEAGRDLSLTSASALASDGSIRANRDATVSAGPVRLASLSVGRNLGLTASELTVTRNAVAGGSSTLTANSVAVNQEATLGSVGALSLTATSLGNSGTIASEAGLMFGGRSSPTALSLTNSATGRIAGGTSLSASYATLQNAGIVTSGGALTLTGGGFTNSREITAQGALTLRAGPITNSGTLSAAQLDVASDALLTNATGGVVQATDSVRIASASATNAGRIISNGAVSLGVETLTNDGGTIVAGTDLSIGGRTAGASAATLRHLSGQIGSVAGDIRLTANAVDSRAAITAGRDFLLTAGGRVDGAASSRFEAGRDLILTGATVFNNLGTSRANRDASIAAVAITSSQLSAGGNLRLGGATLENTGNVVAGGVNDLRLTTSVTNRTGATIGGVGGLSIVSPLIDNAGTLASEASAILAGAPASVAGGLINRSTGRISGGAGLTGTFASIDNSGIVTSAADLALTGGELFNDREITGAGAVTLRFASIDHPGLTSGRTVTVSDADDIEIGVVGVIQATDTLTFRAATLTNFGLVASGGTILASVGDLTNDHASIISRGNLTIEGLTAASRAGTISNLSGDIESVHGNISLAAGLIDNVGDGTTALRTTEIRHEFITGQRPPPGIAYYPDLISAAGYFQLYDEGRTREFVWVPSPEEVNIILAAEGITIDQWTPTLWRKYAPDPATFDPTLWAIYIPDEDRHAPAGSYIAAVDESDVVTRQNAPGQIITGRGNITIDAGVLQNTLSTISANGDLVLNGGSVINEGKTLMRSYSLSASYDNGTIRGEGWPHPPGGMTQWFNKGNRGPYLIRQEITGVIPSTINATGTITGNLAGTFVNVGTPATDPATLSFANTSTTLVTVTQAPPATSVSMAALAGTSGTGTGVAAGTSPIPTSIRIPESQLRQFAPANPNSRFLIETRLQFINLADYFGSDYFFSRLGTRPDDDLKVLGDAYFDYLLIRDQIVELTGKRFIDPALTREQDQIEALISAGANLVRQLGLKVGQPLTRDQQASLTQNVVIYEEIQFRGQRVLVPHLYLTPSSAANPDGRSARVSARIVDIASAVFVNDNGTINGTDGLRVATSGDIVATGGLFTGKTVELSAGGAIALAPILTTTGDGDNRVGTIKGNLSEIRGSQSVLLQAPTISIVGSRVLATDPDGQIKIDAQRLNIGPAEAFAREAYSDKNVKFDVSRNMLLLSDIQAGGSIDITATDTAFIRAATLTAGDDVRIHAGELFIASGQERSRDTGQFNKKGFTKSTTQWDHIAVTQIPTVIDAGGSIELSSTVGDITITASILKGSSASFESAGQVRVETAYNERFDSNSKQGGNLFITSTRAKGVQSDTVVPTEIYADKISIHAEKGVILQFKQVDAEGRPIGLDQSIEDLSQFKGLAYLSQLKNQAGVTYQGMPETFKTWDYHQVGLSGPAAAVIVLALSYIIPNPFTLSQFGLSGLSGFSGALVSGSQLALSGLAKATATTFLTTGGDIGATLRSIGSSDTLKALATTVVTAGALEGLDQAGFLSAAPETWLGRLRNIAVVDGGRAVVRTAINGGSLSENLRDQLYQDAFATIGRVTATRIGDAAALGEISEATRLIAHAALGCGLAAAQSDKCSSGAVSALAAELATGTFLDNVDPNDSIAYVTRRGIDIGSLSGGVAAFLAGGDVGVGSAIGTNAVEYNSVLTAGIKITLRALKVAKLTGRLTKEDFKAAGLEQLEAIAADGRVLSSADATTYEQLKALYDLGVGVYPKDIEELAIFLSDSVKGLASENQNGKAPGATIKGAAGSAPAGSPVPDPEDDDKARDSTKTDNIVNDHLTEEDLEAARRELNGEVVARRSDGTPYDHVREVRDAQQGLTNRIEQIRKTLSNPNTTSANRARLEAELSKASRNLDHSEGFVPRK